MSFVEMSFSATVLILIIMLLRKFLLDRLPKRAFLILWGIALLRLLVPVSVPSSFSIYSLIQRWDDGRENMTGSSRTISSVRHRRSAEPQWHANGKDTGDRKRTDGAVRA
jgi:beta-lactamase regulating signal transducer with metallopeptidase domain